MVNLGKLDLLLYTELDCVNGYFAFLPQSVLLENFLNTIWYRRPRAILLFLSPITVVTHEIMHPADAEIPPKLCLGL